MRLIATRTTLHRGIYVGLAALGCSNLGDLSPSPVGRDAAWDGWVDVPTVAGGDGRTAFVSRVPFNPTAHAPEWRELPDSGYPAPAAVEGGRIYGLSSYAGLVITDASEAGPSRVEGRYPIGGAPFRVSVQNGIVLALVNDGALLSCLDTIRCQVGQSGRVLLIDARDPSAPRLLAERRLPGALTHAERIGDTLYTVSRELVACYECADLPERRGTVTALGLGALTLTDFGQLELAGGVEEEAASRAYLFAGPRLYVATGGVDLRVVELGGELRWGPSAPLPGYVLGQSYLREEAGIVQVGVHVPYEGSAELAYRVATPGELTPIDPIPIIDSDGERVWRPLFHGGKAFSLSGDGRALFAYDLSVREAPRLAGTLALPFAAGNLLGTTDGELALVGTGNASDEAGAVHLARVDVRDVSAPALLGELSWGQNSVLSSAPRYDAASRLLFVPHRQGEVTERVVVVAIEESALVLRNDLPAFYGASDEYLPAGERLVSVRQAWVSSVGLGGADTRTVRFVNPTEAVRVAGDHIVRFADTSTDAQLLALPVGDPLAAEGAPFTSAAGNPPAAWTRSVFQREGQLYLVGQPVDGAPAVGVYGFDASVPGALAPTGTVRWAVADSAGRYLDTVQTRQNLVVASGQVDTYLAPGAAPADTRLGYDIIDVSQPGAPRFASHFDVPAALIEGGFARWAEGVSIDTAWGWRERTLGAPPLSVGDLLVTQHAEPSGESKLRFLLDRLDVSDPDAPVLLPPVNVPGIVLDFDDASGSVLTLERLDFEERMGTDTTCRQAGEAVRHDYVTRTCHVSRRALAGLSLEGDVAVRRSQLVLDNEQIAISFALSDHVLYFVTEPALDLAELQEAESSGAAGLPITIQRARIEDGQLTRLPSVDVSGLLERLPRQWRPLLAREQRLYTVSNDTLGIVDFNVDPPSVRSIPLPAWGCSSFEVAGARLYCARGAAGLEVVDLALEP